VFACTPNEAEVVLSCEVVNWVTTPFVRVETPMHPKTLASHQLWKDALRQVDLRLLDWLVETYDVCPRKAVTHFNANPQVQVRVHSTSLGEKTKGSVGVCFPTSALKGTCI
jgi:hypothetical protein